MSRNVKIILVIVGALVCSCGLLCIAGYIVLPQLGQSFVGQAQDPANIRRIASEIAEFTLPLGFKEQFGFDLLGMKIVAFSPASDSTFFLMLMQMPQANADRAEMERQLRQQTGGQSSNQCSEFRKVGEETVTIKGAPTTMVISECVSQKGLAMRQQITYFQGKGGLALVMAMGVADRWGPANDTALRRFLESIK